MAGICLCGRRQTVSWERIDELGPAHIQDGFPHAQATETTGELVTEKDPSGGTNVVQQHPAMSPDFPPDRCGKIGDQLSGDGARQRQCARQTTTEGGEK